MNAPKDPFPFANKKLKEEGLRWTALTYAKVLRGPFTYRDLNSISETKFPISDRNAQKALEHLLRIELLKMVDVGVYQITPEGIKYVYVAGQYFSRQRRRLALGN